MSIRDCTQAPGTGQGKDGNVTVDLAIRGGQVVHPYGARPGDVLVDAGRIVAVTEPGAGPAARRSIDATGLTVLPGAIDAHVHFDAPGRDDWEGWQTGSLAAAAGGVTTVIDMPIDSDPPTLDAAAVQAKRAVATASSLIDFALWGGLVPQNVAALDDLLQSGVVGLKAFMCDSGWPAFPRCDAEVLSQGMAAAAQAGLPVAVHCEDPAYFGADEGDRPEAAEVAAVETAGTAAASVGARLHVVHCSSARAAVRAKQWASVTVETCPHYLMLADVDVARLGAEAICYPPIRDSDNQARLWDVVRNGTIDSVASDHSPCPLSLKVGPRPFPGIAGVQTTLSLLLSSPGLSLPEVSRLRTAAARLFGLPRKGEVAPGYDADLALVDLDATWTVNAATLRDRQRRSPFCGAVLQGVVQATLVRGELVYEAGRQTSDPIGRFCRPGATGRPHVQNKERR
jgi:allantoinase